MKPRNIKQAFEQGFKVYNIYAKGSKQIRVDFERRFPKYGERNHYSYWIDKDYFARTYPNIYDRF